MYELISNLILYGNLPEDEILVQLAKLLSDDEKSNHELRQEIYGQIKSEYFLFLPGKVKRV